MIVIRGGIARPMVGPGEVGLADAYTADQDRWISLWGNGFRYHAPSAPADEQLLVQQLVDRLVQYVADPDNSGFTSLAIAMHSIRFAALSISEVSK
ncbi:hypothetical protein VST63_03020 [Mycolicibacterium sp. 050232]|uniref:hypothetical protein n=1 Tax=Mycolicibacterium sp. 050232 TaxID=3113982 RepID=UPI002E27ACB1|nr:hypothetical protein [Mycolicibacterium sp. 050232]MED5811320.1 hypothetical protein [Mycolicibacterium sp. 050232]